jgi:AAT family amino acid transporter
MAQTRIVRQFQSPLATGIAATAICLVAVALFWPLWGLMTKSLIGALAEPGIRAADPKLAAKYISNFTEGTFFFLLINSWIWQCLIFGLYGKTYPTDRQPGVGIWYTCVGFISGTVAILVLSLALGSWWRPFSLSILFMPKTAEEIQMAIEGWELINFYTLGVLIVQIPSVSLFHKWPFAGKANAPLDGLGVFMTSTVVALLVWIGTVFPSLANLRLGEEQILTKPFNSWPAYLAFGQAFIWWFLIPAEGGEHYPMKLFAKKQPFMGIAGLVIALIGGFVTPIILRPFVTTYNLGNGMNPDIAVASLEISVILFTLLWHHLFEDYPSAQILPNQAARVIARIAIWLVGGLTWGIFWLDALKVLPFGANDLGLGYPPAGPLAGQFALIMILAIFNTYFDKWPLVRKVSVSTPAQVPVGAE